MHHRYQHHQDLNHQQENFNNLALQQQSLDRHYLQVLIMDNKRLLVKIIANNRWVPVARITRLGHLGQVVPVMDSSLQVLVDQILTNNLLVQAKLNFLANSLLESGKKNMLELDQVIKGSKLPGQTKMAIHQVGLLVQRFLHQGNRCGHPIDQAGLKFRRPLGQLVQVHLIPGKEVNNDLLPFKVKVGQHTKSIPLVSSKVAILLEDLLVHLGLKVLPLPILE